MASPTTMPVSKEFINSRILEPPRSSDGHVTTSPWARPDRFVPVPPILQQEWQSMMKKKQTPVDTRKSMSIGLMSCGLSSSKGFACLTSSDSCLLKVDGEWSRSRSNSITPNNSTSCDSFPIICGPTSHLMPLLSCTRSSMNSSDNMNTGNKSRLSMDRKSISCTSMSIGSVDPALMWKFLRPNECNSIEWSECLEGKKIDLSLSHSLSGLNPPKDVSMEQTTTETTRGPFLNTVALERSCSSSVPLKKRRIMEPIKPPAPLHVAKERVGISQTKEEMMADILSIMAHNKKTAAKLKRTPKKKEVRRHAQEPVNKEYVDEPTQFDVLFGRGTGPRLHSGNQRYYKIVGELRDEYRKGSDSEKQQVARQLIKYVKDSGGRFLRQDEAYRYYVVPAPGALNKARQALREHKFPHERN